MIGVPVARDKLTRKYIDMENEKCKNLSENAIRNLSAAAKRNMKLAPIQRRICLETFLELTIPMLPGIGANIAKNLDILVEFLSSEERDMIFDPSRTKSSDPSVSLKSLRHLMVDNYASSSLQKAEFNAFLQGCGISAPNHFDETEQDILYSADNFLSNLIVGEKFQRMER